MKEQSFDQLNHEQVNKLTAYKTLHWHQNRHTVAIQHWSTR